MDSVVKFTLAVIFLCPALTSANLLDDAEDAMREAVTIIEDDYAASDGTTEYIGCEYYDACDSPPSSSYSSDQIPGWLTSGTPYHEICNDSTPAASFPESPDCDAANRSCSLDVSYDRATSYFTTDTDFESQTVKQATCVLRDLDLKIRDFSNILDVESYAEYMYASVGRTGGLTIFPGTAWSCPSSYNALFRPWYPTAAIGPKNIILIIDVSGSMSGNRLTLAKAAAIRVLDTLSDYDYVGLVSFSSTAAKYSDTLKPFTSNEACLLTDYINDLRLGTTTNYEAAFTAAFDIFDRSVASGDSVPCNTNAMLFLTDGEITEGSSGSDLYDMISARNPNVDVRILTYALGSDVDTSVTRQIAYDNKGAAYSISDDSDDLGSVMASYYDLFIGTVVPETVAPIWIRYREFNSGEFVCTVCLSAYDIPYFEENGVSQVLGVVCADLIEEHISDVMGSSDDLYKRLNATASQCPTFEDPTEKQLNLIRSTMSGSPHVYTDNWIAWGIPVIVVVSIVIIIIVVVVVINGNKSKYTPNQPPSAGSGPHDAAGPNPAAANSNAQGNNSISGGVSPDNPYPPINAINANNPAQLVQPFVETKTQDDKWESAEQVMCSAPNQHIRTNFVTEGKNDVGEPTVQLDGASSTNMTPKLYRAAKEEKVRVERLQSEHITDATQMQNHDEPTFNVNVDFDTNNAAMNAAYAKIQKLEAEAERRASKVEEGKLATKMALSKASTRIQELENTIAAAKEEADKATVERLKSEHITDATQMQNHDEPTFNVNVDFDTNNAAINAAYAKIQKLEAEAERRASKVEEGKLATKMALSKASTRIQELENTIAAAKEEADKATMIGSVL